MINKIICISANVHTARLKTKTFLKSDSQLFLNKFIDFLAIANQFLEKSQRQLVHSQLLPTHLTSKPTLKRENEMGHFAGIKRGETIPTKKHFHS